MTKSKVNKEIISSSLATIGTLTGFFLAKRTGQKNELPFTLLGGLAGTVLATLYKNS